MDIEIENEGQAGGAAEPLSIRQHLEAAMAESAAADAGSGAGEAEGGAQAPASSQAGSSSGVGADVRAGLTRDEAGRFTAAAGQAQSPDQTSAQASAASDPAGGGTISPPAGWSPAAKAEFAKLPPVVQQAAIAREQDVLQAKAQWDQKAGEFNRYEQVFGPVAERAKLNGIDKFAALQQLVAASDLLEKNPVQGIGWLARSYGVDLRRFTAGAPAQAQPSPQDQAYQQLAQQVQSLTASAQARDAQALQQEQARARDVVAAFAAKPEHQYFENVKSDMSRLMQTGLVQGATYEERLASAYDMAVHARSDIRPLVLASQAQADQQRRASQAQQRAAGARAASGSTVGSPAPGAAASRSGPPRTLRQELEANMAALS